MKPRGLEEQNEDFKKRRKPNSDLESELEEKDEGNKGEKKGQRARRQRAAKRKAEEKEAELWSAVLAAKPKRLPRSEASEGSSEVGIRSLARFAYRN